MENKKSNTEKVLFKATIKIFENRSSAKTKNNIGVSLVLLFFGIGLVLIPNYQELKHPEILYVAGSLLIFDSVISALKNYSVLKKVSKNIRLNNKYE